jgi:hypothetical protein
MFFKKKRGDEWTHEKSRGLRGFLLAIRRARRARLIVSLYSSFVIRNSIPLFSNLPHAFFEKCFDGLPFRLIEHIGI